MERSERQSKRGKAVGEWEKERKEYYKRKSWDIEKIEEIKEGGVLKGEDIVRRKSRRQGEERWKRIGESRFNRWYSWIKGKSVSNYLRRGWNEERWQRIAKCRLGDSMRRNKWEKEKRRKCRICG